MHPETINKKTRECLEILSSQSWLKSFYLAGGTALALHLGHRLSYDLDFFSSEGFDPKHLRNLLQPLGDLTIEMEKPNMLWVILNETKLSFFQYSYPLLENKISFGPIDLASIKDISCMKLDTISSRGSRKDFVDLYFILKEGYGFEDIWKWFEKKYHGIKFNKAHILKSLTYFEDAEKEPPLNMIREADWNEVKRIFQAEAKKVILSS